MIPKEESGIKFKRCYCNYLDNTIFDWLEIHKQYEDGKLYFPGSLSEQPSKLLELMNLLSKLKNEHQEKLQKQQAKQPRK